MFIYGAPHTELAKSSEQVLVNRKDLDLVLGTKLRSSKSQECGPYVISVLDRTPRV